MQKVITRMGMADHSISYKANRVQHTAPEIDDEFIDDDGETMYVLRNGNQIPKIKYDLMWNPVKGIINRNKMWKGENPDKTKIV